MKVGTTVRFRAVRYAGDPTLSEDTKRIGDLGDVKQLEGRIIDVSDDTFLVEVEGYEEPFTVKRRDIIL